MATCWGFFLLTLLRKCRRSPRRFTKRVGRWKAKDGGHQTGRRKSWKEDKLSNPLRSLVQVCCLLLEPFTLHCSSGDPGGPQHCWWWGHTGRTRVGTLVWTILQKKIIKSATFLWPSWLFTILLKCLNLETTKRIWGWRDVEQSLRVSQSRRQEEWDLSYPFHSSFE